MEMLLTPRQKEKYLRCSEQVAKWQLEMDRKLKLYGMSTVKILVSKIVTSKAKSRHAQVNRNTGELNISEHMFTVSDEEFENTLLHEMCHLYKDAGHGHGTMWKSYAHIASEVSGLDIKRCRNIEGVYSDREERRKELIAKSGLVFKCIGCGQVVSRTRRSNFTEHYGRYRCGRCGGHFDKVTR